MPDPAQRASTISIRYDSAALESLRRRGSRRARGVWGVVGFFRCVPRGDMQRLWCPLGTSFHASSHFVKSELISHRFREARRLDSKDSKHHLRASRNLWEVTYNDDAENMLRRVCRQNDVPPKRRGHQAHSDFSAKGANHTSLGQRPRTSPPTPKNRPRAESPKHARAAMSRGGGKRREHRSGLQPSASGCPGFLPIPGPLAQAGMRRAFGARN